MTAVGVGGVGGEFEVRDVDVVGVIVEFPDAAGGARAVSGELLVGDVGIRGVIGELIAVTDRVAAVSAERVDREVLPVGVVPERVDPAESVGAVIGEVLVHVGGEVDVAAVFLEAGGYIGEAEEIGGGAEGLEAAGEGVLVIVGEFGKSR